MKDLNQLQALSLQDLQAYQARVQQKKSELEAAKVKNKETWTEKLQDSLDEIVLHLVDVDELIEAKQQASNGYTPSKGTEKHVHLVISETRRFDPKTGKQLNRDRVQLFSYSEWRVFKKNFARLGYIIVKVLHDPYNEAAEFVIKED